MAIGSGECDLCGRQDRVLIAYEEHVYCEACLELRLNARAERRKQLVRDLSKVWMWPVYVGRGLLEAGRILRIVFQTRR